MTDFFNMVKDFFQKVLDFINIGIYQFFVDAFAYIIEKSVLIYLQLKLAMLQVSWDVAQHILADINFSGYLAQIYSHFNSDIIDIMLWLHAPEFITIVSTAYLTRFVMRFVPFS